MKYILTNTYIFGHINSKFQSKGIASFQFTIHYIKWDFFKWPENKVIKTFVRGCKNHLAV